MGYIRQGQFSNTALVLELDTFDVRYCLVLAQY